MMVFHWIARSLLRSQVRARILLALAHLGVSYGAELAREAGVSQQRLMHALYGHPPQYRRELALVTLGLVRVSDDANGMTYALTPAGRAEVELLVRAMRQHARVRPRRRSW